MELTLVNKETRQVASRLTIHLHMTSIPQLSATRAERIGFVSEVAPAGGLDAAVERICTQILKAPQPAVLAIKEFARVAPSMDIRGAVDYARSLHAVINSSSEMRP